MKVTHISAEPKTQVQTNRHGVKVAGMAHSWWTNQQYEDDNRHDRRHK